MLNNQYNSKYLNIKKIVKDDGTVVFLEKDHLNSVEDVVLFQDKVIGQRTETAGTPLLTIVEHIAADATTSTCAINNIKVNGIAQVPDSSKTVDIPVPTKLADLTEDSTHKFVSNTDKTTWNAKQDALVFEGGNYDPATNKVLCKSDIAAFTGATRFRGKVEHAYDIDDPKNGDIIIMGTKEYIYCDECDPVWSEIGDESTHAVKGSIVNSDIAADAAIAQSKVAGLVDVLDSKVDVESGKSLVDDTEIEKIHEHDNKTTLDAITAEAWNSLVGKTETDPVFTEWKNGNGLAAGGDGSSAAKSYDFGVALGIETYSRLGVAVGPNAEAGDATTGIATAVGRHAQAKSKYSVALGGGDNATSAAIVAKGAEGAVQIGIGTNNVANTLKFKGTTVVDASGKIPTASLEFNPDTKVNVVSGKGLSTNDYTTAEKNKLASEVELVFTLSDNNTKTFKLVGTEVTES